MTRVGFTPLKGTRHAAHPSVQLEATGPAGDRVFCLVDPARARVLRTVENPTLVQATAAWDGTELSVTLPAGTVAGAPVPTGERVKVDYWGRVEEVELVDGGWAEAFSAHLGYEVRLGRVLAPGAVVYGASVTLVTTASLARLSAEVGIPVDGARFRSTLCIDTDEDTLGGGRPAPYAEPCSKPLPEEAWVGRELRLGEARLRVRGTVPRCAVVDLHPATGRRDQPVLKALAGYRRAQGEVLFGVDAVVTRPGVVRVGDDVTLERG